MFCSMGCSLFPSFLLSLSHQNTNVRGVSNGNIYMVPKRLKGIINAHIQRSIMYAGYCNDFWSSNIHIFSQANDFIFVSFLIAWRHRRKGNKLEKHKGAWGVDKDKCTAYGDQIFNYTQGYDDNPMQLKALYSKRMPSQTPTTTPPPLCLSQEKTKGDKMES